MLLLQAYTAENYPEPDHPYYFGKYAAGTLEPVETLTVVSYNIWFAKEIDQALLELKEIHLQKEVDVLLLQEMDEVGVEEIARGLQMNYVYFPAAVEPTYDKNFGNAILSRWPIINPHKQLLPHQSLSNRMNRTATKAVIQIHDVNILVYSVHTESIFIWPQSREDQYSAILEDIDSGIELVIVGGDFNSFTQGDVDRIEEVFQQAGYMRVSRESGYTVVKYGIGVTTDHIFAKGFVVEEAGAWEGTTASDHLPIWVTLALK